MAETPTSSFRLPEQTRRQLDELAEAIRAEDSIGRPANHREIICAAVDFLYRNRFGAKTSGNSGKSRKKA